MYRYKGATPSVVFIDGVAWPLDPNRLYDEEHYPVKHRSDLFIRGSANKAEDKQELDAANARIAELESELDENAQAVAEFLADQDEVIVEAATAEPGQKRTRVAR